MEQDVASLLAKLKTPRTPTVFIEETADETVLIGVSSLSDGALIDKEHEEDAKKTAFYLKNRIQEQCNKLITKSVI